MHTSSGTNLSADIRGLFVEACAMVGVACRPAGNRNISVARRDSVAIINRMVGPKGWARSEPPLPARRLPGRC
jgi:hypothetical protein